MRGPVMLDGCTSKQATCIFLLKTKLFTFQAFKKIFCNAKHLLIPIQGISKDF